MAVSTDQGYLEVRQELWLVSMAVIRGQGVWQGTGLHFLGVERLLLFLCPNLDLNLEVYYLLPILVSLLKDQLTTLS